MRFKRKQNFHFRRDESFDQVDHIIACYVFNIFYIIYIPGIFISSLLSNMCIERSGFRYQTACSLKTLSM